MKYIDADLLKSKLKDVATEFKTGNYYLDNSEQAVGYENALIDFEKLISSLQQEQDLIVINKKDWEAQEQFRKNKDFGKPIQQEQPTPSENLKLNMTRTKLELNEIETLTHLVRAKVVESGSFQGLYKGILSKLNKMFDEEYAERERKEEK